MLKKIRIGRMLLLLVVIVIANLYFGCVNKYYPPDYQTKEGAKIQQQEEQIKAIQKEKEGAKIQQQEEQIKAMQKEIEELKKQQ